MDGYDLLLLVARVVLIFALLMVVTILLVWFERKVVADMQNRIGPQRAGPFGILQTLADGVKLFFKEQVTPRKVEFGLYLAAPMLAAIPAFLMFMVVPFGDTYMINLGGVDRSFPLQGADLNVGLLYILAMSSIAVYAIVLAGWSSGSKYPLLGGVRATAQAISYEAAMGLSLVPVVIFVQSLRLSDIVAAQDSPLFLFGRFEIPFITTWNVMPLFPSFIIFAIAAVAETNRAPFDLVEAEQEIVGGFHTEYSGLRFALFFLAEYINMFTMSALVVTLFFGGWLGPVPDFLPTPLQVLMPTVWFLLKVIVFLFIYVWLRGSLPRYRYDQLMTLGWKRLIPSALAWLMVFGLVRAVIEFGPPWS